MTKVFDNSNYQGYNSTIPETSKECPNDNTRYLKPRSGRKYDNQN